VPSTSTSAPGRSIRNGMSGLFATSKKASPVSLTARDLPAKVSGYSNWLFSRSHIFVPSESVTSRGGSPGLVSIFALGPSPCKEGIKNQPAESRINRTAAIPSQDRRLERAGDIFLTVAVFSFSWARPRVRRALKAVSGSSSASGWYCRLSSQFLRTCCSNTGCSGSASRHLANRRLPSSGNAP
jgi:hypothetical protein